MSFAAPIPVATPEPFSFSRPDEWPKWIRRFERFRIASGLVKMDEKTQVNSLIYTMGDKADDILTSFRLSTDDSEKYTSIREKFDSHFVRRRNTIYERAKFNQRIQQQGESADSFVTDLYALAENCSYGGLHDEMIRDRIVVGIRDRGLSEKMQLQPGLDLEKAVTQVLQAEAVKNQQPLLRVGGVDKGQGAVGMVGAVGASRKEHQKTNRISWERDHKKTGRSCSRCVGKHSQDQHCPARGAICRKCSKKGHYQAVCRSATVGGVKAYPSSGEDVFLGAVGSSKQGQWTVRVTMNGTPMELQIDTGAEVTVITEKAWRSMGAPPVTSSDRTLRGPASHELTSLGKFGAEMSARQNKGVIEDVYVVKGLHRCLLGRPAIEKLELLAVNTIAQVK